MKPAGAPGDLWGPPRAEERGRPPRTARWGWLACLVGASLLVGAVAVEAQVGSVGSIAAGVRLPSGATSVTAEPNSPDPETTVALDREQTARSVVVSTSVPVVDSLDDLIPTSVSTAPKKSGSTRSTSPTSVGAPAAELPPPPTQIPTATTSGFTSPPTTAALSTSTSQLVATTATALAIVTTTNAPTTVTTAVTTTAVTTTTVTTTTVAPFDPAQCTNWLYFLLHWTQCRALLPPPSTSTSTRRPPDD